MKVYSKYKKSGIGWIGEIPQNWNVTKLKYSLESLNTKRVPLSSEVRGNMEIKKYDYYGASGIIDKVEDYIFNETLILIGEDGANLLSRSSPLAFLAKGKYWVNNHAHILKPKFGNLNYFVNFLELVDYSIFVTGSAQPKLTQENLSNIFMLSPPIEDQNSIANYLENKITQLNKTISQKQQLITLYEEERKAIINQAVTKGIRPDVKMKDSGIEWIGDVPEDWEVLKINHISNITRLAGYEYSSHWEVDEEGEIIALRGYNVGNNEVILKDFDRISNKLSLKLSRSRCNKNDIVFPCVGTVGKAVLIEEDDKYHINQNIAKLTPITSKVHPKFLLYFLLSHICKYQIMYYNTSGAQPNVLVGNLRKFKICLPTDLKEQIEIVKYIENGINKVRKLIDQTQKEITLLEEYRQALIYEAVTGKIDVRDEV